MAAPLTLATRSAGSVSRLPAVSMVKPSRISCCVPSRSPLSGCSCNPSVAYSRATVAKPAAASALLVGRAPGAAAPWSST